MYTKRNETMTTTTTISTPFVFVQFKAIAEREREGKGAVAAVVENGIVKIFVWMNERDIRFILANRHVLY